MQKPVDIHYEPEKPQRRSFLMFVPVLVFLGIAAMFGYALTGSDPSKLPSALIGKPAPVINLTSMAGLEANGQPVPGFVTADLKRGDVVVVNFWASWCVPCVQEHPLLTQLKNLTDVRLVGINHRDPAPGGLRFLQRLGNPFDAVGVDPTGRDAIDWGVYGMPETFVIDGRGRIAHKHVGPITPELLRSKIIPAIAAARAQSAN